MEIGLFTMPTHPPERSPWDAAQWNLQVIQWAEEFGFSELWMGEHFASAWEPIPAPDLLLAQAFKDTERIRLGPGGHLLPYHHPVELACRVAYLDHLSQGRLNFGIAASGLPGDWKMFNIDGFGGQNREMFTEALDIILRLWTDEEPTVYRGKYWDANRVDDPEFEVLYHHIKPFQDPYPPIGIAGFSQPSPTLVLAGEKGFLPMSLNLNLPYVKSHWDSVVEGAAKSGRTANRKDWRVVRTVMVADTDAEARKICLDGYMARFFNEYWLKLFAGLEALPAYKHDLSIPDSEVTPEYLCDHNWLVGSPDTVVAGIEQMYEELGGFGSLLLFGFDYSDDPEAWKNCMRLLGEEVLPRVRHLVPEVALA